MSPNGFAEQINEKVTVNIVRSPLNDQADFVSLIDGNSLEPDYSDGDHVLVRFIERDGYVELPSAGDTIIAIRSDIEDKRFKLIRPSAYDITLIIRDPNYPYITCMPEIAKIIGIVLGKAKLPKKTRRSDACSKEE